VLVEDIARKANTVAHTARLHRESVGDFGSSGMIDMAAVEALAEQGLEPLRAKLLPADSALARMPAANVTEEDALRFSGGQVVATDSQSQEGLARVYAADKRFLGVGELLDDGQLAPRRVFRPQDKTP
jgi:tRNA pseudouridine55 synthase